MATTIPPLTSAEPAAAFFGFMGGSVGLIMCCLGSAYGTAKAGVGLASVGVLRPQIVMKCIVPIIMASVVAIYGLIMAVVVGQYLRNSPDYTYFNAFSHLGAGLCVGFGGLSAGFAIGIVGDAGVRATAQQPSMYVVMILILIFAEALGLYGLIIGLVYATKK